MPMFEVKIEIKYTKKYYVHAMNEEQASEKYLTDGLSSSLYETEIDRKVLDVVRIVKKDNEDD